MTESYRGIVQERTDFADAGGFVAAGIPSFWNPVSDNAGDGRIGRRSTAFRSRHLDRPPFGLGAFHRASHIECCL